MQKKLYPVLTYCRRSCTPYRPIAEEGVLKTVLLQKKVYLVLTYCRRSCAQYWPFKKKLYSVLTYCKRSCIQYWPTAEEGVLTTVLSQKKLYSVTNPLQKKLYSVLTYCKRSCTPLPGLTSWCSCQWWALGTGNHSTPHSANNNNILKGNILKGLYVKIIVDRFEGFVCQINSICWSNIFRIWIVLDI